MKRTIASLTLVIALALPASSLAQASYGWTISASSTSPYVNTTAPTGTLATYYLWLACCDLPNGFQDGMAAAEFDIVTSAPNSHIATIMKGGFLNAGSTVNLLLAVGGCPCGPFLAANFLVLSLVPGTMDLAPSGASGVKGTVDCSPNPQIWPIDWIGLGIGLPSNGKGSADCIPPVSVEESSWGTIKGLYR